MGCLCSKDKKKSAGEQRTAKYQVHEPQAPKNGGRLADNSVPSRREASIKGLRTASNESHHGPGLQIKGGPLSQMEYNQRVISSMGTQSVALMGEGYSVNYAFVSQRGYYPDALDKSNQDTYCVHPKFGGKDNAAFFGVFDGHGEHGTACSHFTRDRLVQNLLKELDVQSNVDKAYHKAFVDTNTQLHRHHIDDSMSGTTAITVMLKGSKLHVANVGDSRAVCAIRSAQNRLVAEDLTYDQTPFRADECERVRKRGARVLTLDQLEGLKDPDVQCWGNEDEDDGDPPRLWAQTGLYPGTAFTRSVGDAVAEKIGVFAEPECSEREVTLDLEYIILASDGIFEFLSSQAVVDMVAKFDNVQEAANALVSESYRLWLQYETRTDDITIIILKVKWIDDGTEPSVIGKRKSNMLPTHGALSRSGTMSGKGVSVGPDAPVNRPVRRTVSKRRRAAIQAMLTEGPDEPYVPPADLPRKTTEELAQIAESVKANFLFAHLNDTQRKTTYEAMEKVAVAAGEVVIQQGDKGEHFYVISKGEFDVFVAHGNNKPELVHTYTTEGGVNASFGELSLMYDKPRAATVKAKTEGELWRLHGRAFRAILHKQDNKGIIKVLRSVEVLQSLNIGQLQRLADTLSEESFADGSFIIRQGEAGNEFYVIQSGEVVCTVRKDPRDQLEEAKEVLQLGAGQYFGERALLGNARRAANVIARGNVQCLSISRAVFEEVLGPLQRIINCDRKWRERSVQHSATGTRMPLANLTSTTMASLDTTQVLSRAEISEVSCVTHRNSKESFLLKTWGLKRVVDTHRQSQVMKEHNIQLGLSPAPPIIPNVVKTFKEESTVSLLMHCSIISTLEHLLEHAPLGEKAAAFYAASMILALEHLHNENVVYRSWSTEGILVDEDGHLVVIDYQFSKQLDGPTYTLCGSPEFLAPEVVESKGHTQSVDFWALGVLIYYLLSCETPFAGPDDSEIKIFSKISARQFSYPTKFSATAIDLIDKLLVRDPNARLGYGPGGIAALKKHPWFKDTDWDALGSYARDTVPPPQDIQDCMKQVQKTDTKPTKWEPYDQDRTWFAYF